MIAKDHANIARLDSAIVYSEPAAKGFERQRVWKGLASVYNLFLFVNKRQGEYQKATEYAFKAIEAVREGQTWVDAMGLIHKKLYMGENLAAVEMQDYLYSFGDTLLESFGIDGQRVKIDYDLQPMHLDVDTAIPLGLIINELVTNSLKYAFPDDRRGIITIAFWKNKTGQLSLKISDDGVGKDGAIEQINSTSFGTNLVKILSKKQKEKLEISHEKGYSTLIAFDRFKMA